MSTTLADVVVDPLPLPGPDWGVPQALAALEDCRRVLGLDLAAPTVVGDLSSIVFVTGRHVAKVYPPGTDAAHLYRVAAALAAASRLRATVVLPVAPPVVSPHGVVTVSPRERADGPPVTWPAIGALLRRFHATHADADLPPVTPLRRLPAQVADLPDDVRATLLDARCALLAEFARLTSSLGVGAVHGDVSPGNVLRAAVAPTFIDTDFVARGPREYDLAPAARRLALGEIDPSSYKLFCEAYGHDVRGWDGLALLDRIAALGSVAFRLWDCRRHGLSLDWLPAAVAEWRTPV